MLNSKIVLIGSSFNINWISQNILSERQFLKIEGLHWMVTFLSQCGETCVLPARLAWPPDILFHWLPVSHPVACLGNKSRSLTPHRTPRSFSPSLSSVCALSWSCVFLCSFYVSLSEVPRVSDEHLKHKCNKQLKYRRKQAKLFN